LVSQAAASAIRLGRPTQPNDPEVWEQKYGNIDVDDIQMKMDAIKQKPRERVQKYFERLDKLFRKGKV
jgi:hypothetical protein